MLLSSVGDKGQKGFTGPAGMKGKTGNNNFRFYFRLSHVNVIKDFCCSSQISEIIEVLFNETLNF